MVTILMTIVTGSYSLYITFLIFRFERFKIKNMLIYLLEWIFVINFADK